MGGIVLLSVGVSTSVFPVCPAVVLFFMFELSVSRRVWAHGTNSSVHDKPREHLSADLCRRGAAYIGAALGERQKKNAALGLHFNKKQHNVKK